MKHLNGKMNGYTYFGKALIGTIYELMRVVITKLANIVSFPLKEEYFVIYILYIGLSVLFCVHYMSSLLPVLAYFVSN